MSDKITQKEVIDKSVADEVDRLNKSLETSIKLMATLARTSTDAFKGADPKNIQEVTKSVDDYNKVNEQSQKTNKEAISNLEKLQTKIKEVNIQEEKAKIALQEKRKAIRDQIKAQKDQTTSSVKLTRELKKEIKTENEASRQNKVLLKLRKDTNGETAKGAKEISLINKKIDNNNSLLEKNSSKLEKTKIGIGEYKKGMSEALKDQEVFGLSLNKITDGLKSGLGIFGAAVAIVAGLGKAYASSARGAEDMARVSDRLQSITKSLGNSLADASGEASFFDGLMREIQTRLLGLSSTINSDIQVSILSMIRQLGILEADQERQKKSQLNRAEQLRQIRDEERNSLEDRKAANDELGEVINKRETDTIELQEKILSNLKTLLAFNEGDLELQQQIKQVEFEIADAREEAQGFRSEMLANDLALSREYIANELELQKLIIEGELQTSTDKFNLRKKLVDITKELELQAAGENEQLINIAIQKAKNAEEQITRDIRSEYENRNDVILSELEARSEQKSTIEDEDLEAWFEYQEELTDIEIEALNKRAEAQVAAFEADKARKEELKNLAIDTASRAYQGIKGFLEAQVENQRNADIEKARSRGASEAEIAKIEKKASDDRKQIAYLDIAINTALGVTKAFVENDWVEALLISAGIIAEGAIQVAAIEAASFAKGTSDSGSKWLDATVGEIGVEKVNLADGTSFYTPPTATKVMLPPHSEVITNNQLQRDLAEMQVTGKSSNDNLFVRKEFKELGKIIKNKTETRLNITENGVSVTAKKGNIKYRYIDNNYRS